MSGVSHNIIYKNTKTKSGISEKLEIATKEFIFESAVIQDAFHKNNTKNHIKNIHIKFSLTISILGSHTNIYAKMLGIKTIKKFLFTKRKNGFAHFKLAFFV